MNYTIKYDEVKHISVENNSGMRVELSSYGASIYNIEIKNNEGVYEYDNVQAYVDDNMERR